MVRFHRTCESCGFENAEADRDCPLCGVSVATTLTDSEAPTLHLPQREPHSAATGADSANLVFADRYHVTSLLGKGGMGDVFRVHDSVSGRDLALKVLSREASTNSASLDRFRREIAVLMRLKHHAILNILDHGVQGGNLFFVTEIVDGQDLRLTLKARGPFPVKDAMALGATVADALAAAHAEGVVHRDVKPANIMMAADLSIRLVDFGLARPEGLDVERVTQTGEFVGTPTYMSPEQFSTHGVDARSDLYSLGIVLFEILTGQPPFMASSVMGVALKHLREAPPPPSISRPDLPPWVDRLVLRCLEKEPSRRFGSAALLAEELRMTHTDSVVRPRRLPSGDSVVVAESPSAEWAMVLAASAEKAGWSTSMALRFEDRLFRLVRVDRPITPKGRWTYRFAYWPQGELIRRLVDYDAGSSPLR
ncbi:MAG: serine/threonine-protein kinase [Vicinamibacteria bacterium]